MEEKAELTYGEKAVGIFNSGSKLEVEKIKAYGAAFIDELDRQRSVEPPQGEKAEQFTLAIREIMAGVMWGVTAATWPY